MTDPSHPFTCEVVAIGTELLLGSSVDTNSTWIGEQLALTGIDSYYHSQVGDNLSRIVSLLRLALERSSAVIVCGGLGPTHDDLTREAIAAVAGVELRHDATIEEQIRSVFRARARAMPENNLRQALVPEGATPIEPRLGTAPGLICPVGDRVIYALPGVPQEMKEMVERAVLPDLRTRAASNAVIASRTLRCWGEAESGLAERLGPLIERLDRDPGVTLAFLASGVEGIRIRLTAKALDPATARDRIAGIESEVHALLGKLIFSTEDETMEEVVLRLLAEGSLRLGIADGVTGGLLPHRIESRLDRLPELQSSFAGAFTGGAAEKEGGVEVMAGWVRERLHCEVGLALLAEKRPGEEGGRPYSLLQIGVQLQDRCEITELRLPGDPEQLRKFSCISALNVLRLTLLGVLPFPAR